MLLHPIFLITDFTYMEINHLPAFHSQNLSPVKLSDVVRIDERTIKNIESSVSDNTKKAYHSDFKIFENWLIREGREICFPVLPETVADYVSYLDFQGYAISTIKRRIRSISFYHRIRGDQNPPTINDLVKRTLSGVKRERSKKGLPTAPEGKMPIDIETLRHLVNLIDTEKLTGLRDKALLLICYAGALRRSEVVFLNVRDIKINGRGADIKITRSKGDQEGKGQTVSILRGSPEFCPVLSLVDYLNESGIDSGPVFRHIRRGGHVTDKALTGKAVAKTIKKYCKLAGMDESEFSGHSLRSGMLTSAAERGVDIRILSHHARHSSLDTTMPYVIHADRYNNNPTDGLF